MWTGVKHIYRGQLEGKSFHFSLIYQVQNWLLCVRPEDLDSTRENEESDLSEKPGVDETAHRTGRVGLQASFVPPIIPLFREVNTTST